MSQWHDIEHMLREVHTQELLTGTDQGDAAYLLGLAAIGTGDWEGATRLLGEASTTAGTEYRADAKARLTEIQHRDAAVAAEADQDVDQNESAAVLAAADEALARRDLDAAHAHYWAVYDGHADPPARAKAALGLANVFAHQDDLVQATQYAQYVTGTGVADAVAGANTLLEWIKEQQAASAAAADGTTIDEFNAANDAARSAFFNGDYARAQTLLTSMLNSPQLGAVERGKAALNLGMAQMQLGAYDDARLNLAVAETHGAAKTVERAQKFLAMIERHDHAEALVAEFEE